MNKICAIHQPNFFPWMPYFEKIRRADVFVILDDAQFSKKGGTWMNRVNINFRGVSQYLIAPVDRDYHGTRKINEMMFVDNDWRDKLRGKINQAYSYTSEYKAIRKWIEPAINFRSNKLVVYNLQAIAFIAGMLNINFADKVVLSSALGVDTNGTQRLMDITKAVGCNVYLTGSGASDYLDNYLFNKEGLSLEWLPKEIYEGQEYSVLDHIFKRGVTI